MKQPARSLLLLRLHKRVHQFSNIIDIPVDEPARVQALFILNGQEVDGSPISVQQDGKKVFGLLPFDTLLAPPGDYLFTASPNNDNELSVSAKLIAGEKTVVRFEMTETIDVLVQMVYPDGVVFKPRRNPELWKDGKRAYVVPPGRDLTMLAGVYELRLKDPLIPLVIDGLEILKNGLFKVNVRFGHAEIATPKSDDFLKQPDRAFIAPVGKRRYQVALNKPVPLLPGRYELTGSDSHGFFAPFEFDVSAGNTTEITLEPLPVGSLEAGYAPGEYPQTPDRAFARRLDDEEPGGRIYLRVDEKVRLPEGQYEITARPGTGDIEPVIVTLKKREPVRVVFKRR